MAHPRKWASGTATGSKPASRSWWEVLVAHFESDAEASDEPVSDDFYEDIEDLTILRARRLASSSKTL